MKSFIEELYYGNIDPQNSGFEDDESVQRTMQAIRENEDFLADTLIGEERKRFLDFANAWSSFNGDSTLDSFVTGFRLGACFVMDAFLSEPPMKDDKQVHYDFAPALSPRQGLLCVE